MPNYLYICYGCETDIERLVPHSESETQDCEVCGLQMEKQFPSPTVLRASYPDGHKRKGWAAMREGNKLVREAAVSKRETANEIRKEIRKIGVRVEK